MASDYRMQIVHRESGTVVEWMPGSRIETDLVEDLCHRVEAKGVGMGTSTAHVLRDVRAAFVEMILALKSQV